MRCVLIGNYGVGNLGDEALKEYFLRRFPDVQWTVVSANPQAGEVPRFPCGARSLFQPWWRSVRAVRKADTVVFGGGTLFTDTESLFACVLWWWHVFLCRIFRKPVALAFQGIGPFRTTIGTRIACHAMRMAAYISVRDKESAIRGESLIKNNKIVQSFDPVILLIDEQNSLRRSKNIFTLIPRMNSGESFRIAAEKLLHGHPECDQIRILSLAPDDPAERAVCDAIRNACTVPASIIAVRRFSELVTEVQRGAFVLSQRFHGAIAALGTGTPFLTVAQAPGDKHASLQGADLPECRSLAMAGEASLHAWMAGEP